MTDEATHEVDDGSGLNRHGRRQLATIQSGGSLRGSPDFADVLLVSVESAARALNSSRSTLYSAIQRGLVKVVKIGRSTRIHRDELERIAREGIG